MSTTTNFPRNTTLVETNNKLTVIANKLQSISDKIGTGEGGGSGSSSGEGGSGSSAGAYVVANPVTGVESDTVDDLMSIFDTTSKDAQAPSVSLSNGEFNFNINDNTNNWSQNASAFNSVAVDLTDYDELRVTIIITDQDISGSFWITLSKTKYEPNEWTWPGWYVNEDSLIKITESGTYTVDVSEYIGDYYIYMGGTTGKPSLSKSGCTNDLEGKIIGTVTDFKGIIKGNALTNPEPVPATDVLNTIQIGETVYKIVGSGYEEEELWSGNPTTTSITLSESVLNFDAIYVECKFNNEAIMSNTIDKATFDEHLGIDYISLATHSNQYFGITPESTATSFVFFGSGVNGCVRVLGLKYGSSSSSSLEEYSTTEKVIGKWIDGRDIYQITIGDETAPVSQQDLSSLNIDFTIDIDGIFGDSNLGLSQCTYTTTASSTTIITTGYVTYTKSTHMLSVVNPNGYVYCVTLKYTKTTD